MARVQTDEIVDELRSEFRRALEEAVKEVIPNAKFDSHELYRAFHRAVRRKCSSWEQISDRQIYRSVKSLFRRHYSSDFF